MAKETPNEAGHEDLHGNPLRGKTIDDGEQSFMIEIEPSAK